jgi:asparagine synthase (glutamine-hydrolysing)
MCGIAGIIQFDNKPIDIDEMNAMLNKLAHRGKDHCQVVMGSSQPLPGLQLSSKANVALGHRRLSIIDLSEAASQPMKYDDGALWLIFNGEIYNYVELRDELIDRGHKFRTGSDTEVILVAYKQWGDECVEHLNGMFAFALWDEVRQRLFCARDHLGVKPFYFYQTSEFIAFASESKSLQRFHGNKLNPDGLASYLLSSYVASEFSIFKGVVKLLPAHIMTVEPSGRIEQKRYWRIKKVAEIEDVPSTRKRLEVLLEQAVRRQIRSDVPVGALLSGGVDSGMVVALASKQVDHLHTYSVGFEGHTVNELPAALAVAGNYRTNHHQREVADKEAIRYLDIALKNLSEPIADPAIIPSYVLSEMAAGDGVKVLLSGTGGDEIFGGYDRYVGGETLQRRLLSGIPESIRKMAGRALPTSSKLGARLRNPSLDMMFTTAGSFTLFSSLLERQGKVGSFLTRLANSIPTSLEDRGHLLYKQMGFDMSVYLPDEILFLFDQMTMANTVEGRVPLLDLDLVEMAIQFPPTSHVNSGLTKVLFRDIAESYLGYEHTWRKKHGFSGPVPLWVNRNLKLFLDTARSVTDIPGLENFDITKYVNQNDKNEVDAIDSFALFTLYCLRRWYDAQCENQ